MHNLCKKSNVGVSFGSLSLSSPVFINFFYAIQVVLETSEENEALKSLLRDLGYTYSHFWIGLSDIQKEGTSVWEETGDQPTYQDYWPENIENDIRDCKAMHYKFAGVSTQFHWENYECSAKYDFICEYPVVEGKPQKYLKIVNKKTIIILYEQSTFLV